MDTVNFEPTVPSPLTMQDKLQFFAFTDGSDGYPPHLNLAGNKPAAKAEASDVQKSTLSTGKIFSRMRLLQLSSLLPTLVPQNFIERKAMEIGGVIANTWFGGMGTPDAGTKLADVENYNRQMRAKSRDIFNLPNVGDLEDWYSDARFAQQHFTGTNPTTIERASERWIEHFAEASKDPADKKAQAIIMGLAYSSQESLYVQDYSYFRKAAEMDESAVIRCEFDETYKDINGKIKSRKAYRYGCASVCLFYLNDAGVLQPLAIVIDWRGAEKCVTIYNRELVKRDADFKSIKEEGAPEDGQEPKVIDEAHDWAWRYGACSNVLNTDRQVQGLTS